MVLCTTDSRAVLMLAKGCSACRIFRCPRGDWMKFWKRHPIQLVDRPTLPGSVIPLRGKHWEEACPHIADSFLVLPLRSAYGHYWHQGSRSTICQARNDKTYISLCLWFVKDSTYLSPMWSKHYSWQNKAVWSTCNNLSKKIL